MGAYFLRSRRTNGVCVSIEEAEIDTVAKNAEVEASGKAIRAPEHAGAGPPVELRSGGRFNVWRRATAKTSYGLNSLVMLGFVSILLPHASGFQKAAQMPAQRDPPFAGQQMVERAPAEPVREGREIVRAAVVAPVPHAKSETRRPPDKSERIKRFKLIKLKDAWKKSKIIALTDVSRKYGLDGPVAAQVTPLVLLEAAAPADHIRARDAKRKEIARLKIGPRPQVANIVPEQLAAEPPPVLPPSQQIPPEGNIWPVETIAAAKRVCADLLLGKEAKFQMLEPMREGACGAPVPISLSGAGMPRVMLAPAITLNCATAAALVKWLDEKVQPAAKEAFHAPVARLHSAASYACRNRYGRAEAPLSEHALANAVDIAGFELEDGRLVKVSADWGAVHRDVPTAEVARGKSADEPKLSHSGVDSPGVPTVELLPKHPDYKQQQAAKLGAGDVAGKETDAGPAGLNARTVVAPASQEQSAAGARSAFLRRVHEGACGIFGTVLGPEANDAHRDHLHLDMKSRPRQAYCE